MRSGRSEREQVLSVLGRELRSIYGEMLSEPVPPHLAPLIEKLDRRDRKSG